ncbi:DUF4153 domain-containing protein [Algoriphagus lacus]|uniref:DUF4153 domain-containing protein n=1 Tax=Algoriphagus lacus TaxID=2056311 RepID=A0A418PME1_9BACT|nr:DUF4153 domain-containing protein [Algoriphagus lacus]RIW12548.1 DUF4153 domain-containing protein [Algoriphagus lacus]
MKELILSNLEHPFELEKLYRKNKSEFKTSFNSLYPEIMGKGTADFWNARLNLESETVSWGTFHEWRFILIAAAIAWVLAKLPAIFTWDEEFFYTRNLGFIVFPFVSAYFAWKNRIPLKSILIPLVTVLAAALYINLLPEDKASDTLILACIHLPLLLWGILGYVFSGAEGKRLSKRLDYLNFNGDAVIMGAILGLAGLLMSGITVGLFSLIDINIEKFYFEYIAVFGLVAAPLVATHLTQKIPQLVNKVAPIIAKIFSPLVLIMLVIYLGAIVYAGKDPYNDREFLMLFNMLLIGVMGLIFFSVAEASGQGNSSSGKWVLASLSLVTILVNGVALSAIAFRISEWGITPNRMAVLGVNILMLIHLIQVSRKLISTVQNKSHLKEVGLVLVKYLPVYLIWSAIVVFLFPLLFGFE